MLRCRKLGLSTTAGIGLPKLRSIGDLIMKNLFLICLLLLASVVLAADASPVVGTWKMHTSIAGNENDQECTFTQKDTTLGGTCKTEKGDLALKGTVDGKKVSWQYEVEFNGSPLTLVFTGTLEPATRMSGTIEVQPMGVPGDFTALKAK
jgi:hypothetical protein